MTVLDRITGYGFFSHTGRTTAIELNEKHQYLQFIDQTRHIRTVYVSESWGVSRCYSQALKHLLQELPSSFRWPYPYENHYNAFPIVINCSHTIKTIRAMHEQGIQRLWEKKKGFGEDAFYLDKIDGKVGILNKCLYVILICLNFSSIHLIKFFFSIIFLYEHYIL